MWKDEEEKKEKGEEVRSKKEAPAERALALRFWQSGCVVQCVECSFELAYTCSFIKQTSLHGARGSYVWSIRAPEGEGSRRLMCGRLGSCPSPCNPLFKPKLSH